MALSSSQHRLLPNAVAPMRRSEGWECHCSEVFLQRCTGGGGVRWTQLTRTRKDASLAVRAQVDVLQPAGEGMHRQYLAAATIVTAPHADTCRCPLHHARPATVERAVRLPINRGGRHHTDDQRNGRGELLPGRPVLMPRRQLCSRRRKKKVQPTTDPPQWHPCAHQGRLRRAIKTVEWRNETHRAKKKKKRRNKEGKNWSQPPHPPPNRQPPAEKPPTVEGHKCHTHNLQ